MTRRNHHSRWLKVAAPALALLIAACNDPNPSAQPIVTQPIVPPVVTAPVPPTPAAKSKVTLTGKVVDAPIANANVVVTIGSTTLRTVADGAGNYTLSIEVPTSTAGLPVIITATGVGDQANVKLVSLPGAVSTLVADAGSDAVLSPAENIRANVTHVSTAESALVMEQIGGAAPTTQTQLDDLIKQVNPVKLLDLAATIKLIVDTPKYDLPAGITDTLAFAQNISVRDAYIQDVQQRAPEDIEAAKQDTANSPDAVMQTRASDIPPKLYLTAIDNDARVSLNSGQFVDALTFNPDGKGSYYNAVLFTPTTWVLTNNQIKVTFAEPPQSRGFPTVDTDGDGNPDRQVEARTTTTGYTLVFLSESLVSVTTNFSTTYPGKEVPDRPNQTDTASTTVIVPTTDFAAFLPTSFANNGGKLLTDTYVARDETLGQSQFGSDIFTFNAGGAGAAQATGGRFNWAVSSSGTLTVRNAGGVSISYNGLDRQFANQDANTNIVFAEVTTADAKYVDLIKVIQFKAPLVFDAATLKGSYYLYGLGNFENGAGFDGRLMGSSFEFNEDRTGYFGSDFIDTDSSGKEVVVRPDFNSSPAGFVRWSVDSTGALVTRRVFDGSQSTAKARRSCDPDSNSNCVVWDERKLVPFSLDDTRNYWLEVRRTAVNSQTAINSSTPISHIARYWDMTSMFNAITGSWQAVFPNDTGAGKNVVVSFMGNGQYVIGGVYNDADCSAAYSADTRVEVSGNGWEKGNYAWNPTDGLLSVSNTQGTDGDCGFVEGPQAQYDDREFLRFEQDGALAVFNQESASGRIADTGIKLRRIASVKRQLIGGWKISDGIDDAGVSDPLTTVYFFPNNTYLEIEAQSDSQASAECANGGVELGNFSFDSATGQFSVSGVSTDTNGSDCGVNDANAQNPFTLTFNTDTRVVGSRAGSSDSFTIDKITTP